MLICVDYDGVIVDSIEQQLDVATTAQRIVNAGRVPVIHDFRIVKDLSPLGFADHIGIPHSARERWCSHVHERMISTEVPAPIFPGALEFLSDMSASHTVVVITSNAREVIEKLLVASSLRERISEIYDSSMPGTKDIKIRQAMARFGFEASESCMIGDTLSDVRHGKHAGVKTIAVAWGYQGEQTLKQADPDYIARDFSDLRQYLEVIS